MRFIIPIEGDGIMKPFRPKYVREVPPGIHYDPANGVAIFDVERAKQMVKDLENRGFSRETVKVLLKKIDEAIPELERLAEEGKVKKEE